jgi:hypothetical protein
MRIAPPAEKAVRAVMENPDARMPRPALQHAPALSFTPGQPMEVELKGHAGLTSPGTTARLHYRHVDQAERWTWLEMQRGGRGFRGTIPAEYTQSPFPLEYYFEVRNEQQAWMVPGFDGTLSNQPYYAVWKRGSSH